MIAVAVIAVVIVLAQIIDEDASFLGIKRRQGVLTLCPMLDKV